jgi:hypothetical protein
MECGLQLNDLKNKGPCHTCRSQISSTFRNNRTGYIKYPHRTTTLLNYPFEEALYPLPTQDLKISHVPIRWFRQASAIHIQCRSTCWTRKLRRLQNQYLHISMPQTSKQQQHRSMEIVMTCKQAQIYGIFIRLQSTHKHEHITRGGCAAEGRLEFNSSPRTLEVGFGRKTP